VWGGGDAAGGRGMATGQAALGQQREGHAVDEDLVGRRAGGRDPTGTRDRKGGGLGCPLADRGTGKDGMQCRQMPERGLWH